MLREFRRWVALFTAMTGLLALAGAAAAQAGPNDIDFMGTRSEGGSNCNSGYCPAGAGTFRADGDKLFACDYKVDNRSVVIRGRYRGKRAWHTVAVNYWGPNRFNGCRTRDAEFDENRSIQFKVCLAKHAKPGPPTIDVVRGTCGAISETFNASRF